MIMYRLNSYGPFVVYVFILLGAIFIIAIGDYRHMEWDLMFESNAMLLVVIEFEIWAIRRARLILFDDDIVYFRSFITNKNLEIISFSDVVSFERTMVNSGAIFYYRLVYKVNDRVRTKVFIPNDETEFRFKELVDKGRPPKEPKDNSYDFF